MMIRGANADPDGQYAYRLNAYRDPDGEYVDRDPGEPPSEDVLEE